jgi:hypothetical protein
MAGPLTRLPAVVAWSRKEAEQVIAVTLDSGDIQIFVASAKNTQTNI